MLNTVEAVVEALGGTAAAASLGGVGMSAVSNWKARGSIPPEKFLTFSRALGELEKQVDPAVFGMNEARA